MQLELEGKLARADLISKYLNQLPQVYQDITINHLLYHTSGLREYTSLLLMRGDDPSLEGEMSSSDAYKLITEQKALDFVPGSQFRYSSSGYVLLAKIIEKIELAAFSNVAKARIFDQWSRIKLCRWIAI